MISAPDDYEYDNHVVLPPLQRSPDLVTYGRFTPKQSRKTVMFQCFGDTGAHNFVDYNFVKRWHLPMHRSSTPYYLELADGSKGANIDYQCNLKFWIGSEFVSETFLVTHLHKYPITLGLPWFNKYLPEVTRQFNLFGHTPNVRRSPASAYKAALQAGGGENEALLAAVEAQIELVFDRQADALVRIKAVAASTELVTLPEEFKEYQDVFDLDYSKNPPVPLHGVEFTIDTINGELPPPATRNIPRSPADRKQEEEQLRDLERLGRISDCKSSPTAAPSFFVNKQCENCHQLRCSCGLHAYPRRWVIDYRLLNAKTPQDAYPLPSIPEILNEVPGHQYYIKFDIDSAFHLVPIRESDRYKTAFLTSTGVKQMNVMTFGFKNAPACFQRMMDATLAPARQYCRAFIDDGIVWADSREELTRRFTHVLSLLRNAGLRLKLKKCEFFKDNVHYLGYIIGKSGTATDPAKLQAITDWPEPRTKTDIRAFLGLAQYYRDFYPHFSREAGPLSDQTKKEAPDKFDKLPAAALAAFTKIKDYWSNPRHLGVFREELPTHLFTDASGAGWGGVIEQGGTPLAFGSGKFNATERRWPTTDRELYACLQMHRRYGHMLTGDVTWWTDHQALQSLRTTLANSPRRIRWRDELDLYPFKIKYKKGADMHVDSMTRHSTDPPDNGYHAKDPLVDPERF